MTVTRCDEIEPEISALLDGELSHSECLAVVDHLLVCEHCRAFYRGGRSLDEALHAAQVVSASDELPGGLWERIEAAARPPSTSRVVPLRVPRRVRTTLFQAAAVLVLALGGWWMLERRATDLPPLPADGIVQVAVESNPGAMDDSRFLQMTTELLQADRRYHLKMYQILSAVNRQTFVREGGREGSLSIAGDNVRHTSWTPPESSDTGSDRHTWY